MVELHRNLTLECSSLRLLRITANCCIILTVFWWGGRKEGEGLCLTQQRQYHPTCQQPASHCLCCVTKLCWANILFWTQDGDHLKLAYQDHISLKEM